MAHARFTGFETGALLAEAQSGATVVGAATIESTIVRTGQYSLKVVPASGANGYYDTGSSTATQTMAFWVQITSLPGTARALFGQVAASSGNLLLNTDGTISYRTNTTSRGTSTVALTETGRWYFIELWGNSPTATKFYIDGKLQVTSATADNLFFRLGAHDTVAATYTAYFDDLAQHTDGAPRSPHSVKMLLPTSLNAAGGWVEGDGAGTAGMAAAVATRPPPGVASASETSATNIESPTNSATDDCDMNLQTYAAAGISNSTYILAVQGIVRHGEDISTGTKAGAVKIVSNPTQSGEDAFNYGNDAGAHAGESGGLWATAISTIQDAPAVTLTTTPVLRVGKRTATTRVVCVDFMGLQVIYQDASLSFNPNRRRNRIIR